MAFRMEMTGTMPCGCTLSHAFVIEDDMDAAQMERAAKSAGETLAYWIARRGSTHVCAEVSETNVNGIPAREVQA